MTRPTHRSPIACAGVALLLGGPLVVSGFSGTRMGGAAARQTTGLVKVTGLGSHAGELCRNDRATLFEDPTGVRILYDPGRTVDEADPRLGDVHLILLSHAHTDHVGDARPTASAAGTCAAPGTISAAPHSTLTLIAAAKNAAVFAGGELADFLGRKIQSIRNAPTAGCPAAGLANELTAPLPAPCTAALRPGGSRMVRRAGAADGVRVAAVPAFHSNGIPAGIVEAPGLPAGLVGYGGTEGGFVITFTNGLRVYLTGDTGLFGDMDMIIRRFYRPSLVVINISDTVTLGPDEAAFAIDGLLEPTTVMPSHTNEQSTAGGVVQGGTRVARFIDRLRSGETEVVLPLSGITRQFDDRGRCIGCR